MKRFLLPLVALGISTASASAADPIFDKMDIKPYWGVRVSYELSCPTSVSTDNGKLDIYGNSSGVSFSGIYNMPVFNNLYFEPGLTIAYNTWSINKVWANGYLSDMFNSSVIVDDASVRMWDLRIPLLLGYRVGLLPSVRVSVFTGPELSLGLGSHSHYSIDNVSVSEGMYGSHGDMNRTDVKWRFGVGADITQKFHVGISGAVGICDRVEGDAKMRNNLFDVTLGYNF